MAQEHIKDCCEQLMKCRYRTYRYHLRNHFNKFDNVDLAREHPYDGVQEEDWNYLCNIFSDVDYQVKLPLAIFEYKKVI